MKASRIVYLEHGWRKIVSTDEIVQNPPEGYRILSGSIMFRDRLSRPESYTKAYRYARLFLDFVPSQIVLSSTKALFEIDADLIYSMLHIVVRNKPWILDMANELPTVIAGSERQFRIWKGPISRRLASDSCKAIICRTRESKTELLKNLGENLREKTHLIYWGTEPKSIKKQPPSDKVRILFLNSANMLMPDHFFSKGGLETILAFINISKRNHNVELILRSNLPMSVMDFVRKFSNIRVVQDVLPFPKLEEIWRSSDIFVLPNLENTTTPAAAFYEAMSYELPIVTTRVHANPELVFDGINGLLVKEIIKQVQLGKPNIGLVKQLTEKLEILVSDEATRKRLGRGGHVLLEDNGVFSPRKRNEKLREIFDSALS